MEGLESFLSTHSVSHPVQAEPNVDDVRRNIFGKMTLSQASSTHLIRFRFQSDSKDNRKGFHLQYKALEFFSACGGIYSNFSGILTSPSHPDKYPQLADCVYLISQPKGTYVNVSFLALDIDCQEVLTADHWTPQNMKIFRESDGFHLDFIEMRDGNSEDSPLMGRFCGNNSELPSFMQTTQNNLRIR